jgi:hypothetical protein
MEHRGLISIWFFIGVLLLIYGIVIFGSGLAGLAGLGEPQDRRVVLAQLHAPVWWGALLIALGALYTFQFAPWRRK